MCAETWRYLAVGELQDAMTVGGVELVDEELAVVDHLTQMQQTPGRQDVLDRLRLQQQHACITEQCVRRSWYGAVSTV